MPSDSSSNVERALEILTLLGDAAPGGLTLAALAAALGESRTSLHRAIVPMVRKGFVAQIGKRGGFRLGPAIYGMAQHRTPIFDAAQRLRPALVAVASRTGHATYLLARIGLVAFCIEMMLGTAPTQTLIAGAGGRLPLGVGPGSIAMLATLDDATRESIIEENQQRYTAYARATPAKIRALVAQAQREGYASEVGMFLPESGAVAVAIPDRSGRAEFAISVTAHSELMTAAMIRNTAHIVRDAISASAMPDG